MCFVLELAEMDRACPCHSVVSCFLLSRFWLLGRKERSQGKSGPGYSRNSKEAELLELREGQKGEGVSYGMRSSKPQQGRLKLPSSCDRKVLKDLELRNGEM